MPVSLKNELLANTLPSRVLPNMLGKRDTCVHAVKLAVLV